MDQNGSRRRIIISANRPHLHILGIILKAQRKEHEYKAAIRGEEGSLNIVNSWWFSWMLLLKANMHINWHLLKRYVSHDNFPPSF